jgi:hypothetical protein
MLARPLSPPTYGAWWCVLRRAVPRGGRRARHGRWCWWPRRGARLLTAAAARFRWAPRWGGCSGCARARDAGQACPVCARSPILRGLARSRLCLPLSLSLSVCVYVLPNLGAEGPRPPRSRACGGRRCGAGPRVGRPPPPHHRRPGDAPSSSSHTNYSGCVPARRPTPRMICRCGAWHRSIGHTARPLPDS